MGPLAILFLPFIVFESVIGGLARGLNLAPPPQPFTQLSEGLPGPGDGSISNLEEEEIERDERGFITKRTIRRKVESG